MHNANVKLVSADTALEALRSHQRVYLHEASMTPVTLVAAMTGSTLQRQRGSSAMFPWGKNSVRWWRWPCSSWR